MPVFPNDEPHPTTSHGDLLVQICGGTEDTVTHALRRLMRVTRASLTLRWMCRGFVRPNTLDRRAGVDAQPARVQGRHGQPDAGDDALMDELVWVQSRRRRAGVGRRRQYQVVRVIRNRVEFWDRTALKTQELIIGRTKEIGAPLDGEHETDVPALRRRTRTARSPR